MSQPISLECSVCGVEMRLNDRGKLGKKAKCPNCGNLFVLTENSSPAKTDPADAGPLPASPPPQSGPTAGQQIKAHQEQPAGGSRAGLLAGAGLGALLLIGAGLWAAGIIPGSNQQPNRPEQPAVAENDPRQPNEGENESRGENLVSLAYLPADAELFVRLNVAEVWKSPLLAQWTSLPQVERELLEWQQKFGLGPDDVESVTIGLAGLSDQARLGPPADAGAVASAARDNLVSVVRTTGDVDAESLKLAENGWQQREHDGQTYYLFHPPAGDAATGEAASAMTAPTAVYLAEPNLVVVASAARIKAAIDSGGRQTRRSDLDFVDPARQLLIAFVPHDKSAFTDNLAGAGGLHDPAGEMTLVAVDKLQAVGLGLNLGSGIDLQVRASCVDDKAAGEIKQLLDGAVAQGREQLEQAAGMPPAFVSSLASILSTVKTSADSSTVTASARISEKTVVALKQAVPQMALALLAGGLLPQAGELPVEPELGLPPPILVAFPSEPPREIEVSAIARWQGMPRFGDRVRGPGPSGWTIADAQRMMIAQMPNPLVNKPAELSLWLYLLGEQPRRAVAWGNVRADEIVADGRKLEIKPSRFRGSADTGFVSIDRRNRLQHHPRQGVKAVLNFARPDVPPRTITRATGTVSLLLTKGHKQFVLKDARSRTGQPIDDPLLTAAGLKLTLTRRQDKLSLHVVGDHPLPELAVAGVHAVDAEGERLPEGHFNKRFINGEIFHELSVDEILPDDVGIEVTIHTGLTQVDVPFDVQNVRVPLPPEAAGQPPASTEGVRDGLKLAGKAEWNDAEWEYSGQKTEDGRPAPPPLDLLLTVTGSPADKAAAWGFVTIDEATTADGQSLKLKEEPIADIGRPQSEFLRVDRAGGSPRHPSDGIRAVVTLEHPARPMKEIAVIRGELKLVAPIEQKTILLPGFPALVGKVLEHADLKAAGLQLKLVKDENRFRLVLVDGDPLALSEVEVTGADDKTRASINRIVLNDQIYYFLSSTGEDVPADAALKLTINVDLRQLTVPFHFENVPVPDAPLD